jgi:hypothetical protein
LIKDKKFQEAEMVHREDLSVQPENGWALIGLYNSLIGQSKTRETESVKKRFDRSWKWADIKINDLRVY